MCAECMNDSKRTEQNQRCSCFIGNHSLVENSKMNLISCVVYMVALDQKNIAIGQCETGKKTHELSYSSPSYGPWLAVSMKHHRFHST